MKAVLAKLKSPALISLLAVLPFMALEAVSARNFNAVFNVPLFGILWLLALIFILLLMPIAQTIRTGGRLVTHPVNLLIKVIFLVFIAWMWASIVMDQMPCFLGFSNCD